MGDTTLQPQVEDCKESMSVWINGMKTGKYFDSKQKTFVILVDRVLLTHRQAVINTVWMRRFYPCLKDLASL